MRIVKQGTVSCAESLVCIIIEIESPCGFCTKDMTINVLEAESSTNSARCSFNCRTKSIQELTPHGSAKFISLFKFGSKVGIFIC